MPLVTRSSTGPSLESTPPSTRQPGGKPGVFQPRQSGAMLPLISGCHPCAPASADKVTAGSQVPQTTPRTAAYRWNSFMVHLSDCRARTLGPLGEPQRLEQRERWSVEAHQRHVADILQVLPADWRRVEAAG